MIIRNSVKGIIIKGNKLLVAEMENNGTYYTLPGGKQRPDELIFDTLKREMAEEAGYNIEPKEIMFIRETFDEYEDIHRVEFMVLCDMKEKLENNVYEYDEFQVGTTWLNIDNISAEPLYPLEIRTLIKNYYLGKTSDVYQGVMNQRSVSFGSNE